MRKASSIGLLSVLAISSIVSGCSGANDSGQGDESKTGDKKQVTLTFWHRWPESQPVFQKAIQEFQQKYPHIKVEMPPIASAQYSAQLQAAVASNDLPDIFSNQSAVPTDQLYQLGLIHDLEDLFPQKKKDEFYEGTWTDGFTTMDGKVYAMPHFTPRRFAHVMYYNLDVLKNAGLSEKDVPKSWDELIAVGKKIREKSSDVYPLILGVKTDWLMGGFIGQMASAIYPDVLPNDGAYAGFNYKKGEYEHSSPGIVQTMKFIKQLQDDKLLHPNSLVIDYREASTLFAGGKAAFVIDGTFLTSELQTNNKFNNFGVAPLPTKDGKPQYYAFQGETKASVHVSKNTKHYEEVKLFLQFYMDRIYQMELEMGVEGSPIIAHNQNTKVDNAQFMQAQKIQDQTFVLSPHQYIRNLAAIKVNTELNGKKPKETIGKLLEGYMAGQIKDLEGSLQKLSADYNAALQDSIKKVQGSGGKVTLNDYKFPNWTPFQPYSKNRYEELGK
ncbi:ABC transporter substrate-binding protein [Paenibacillus sp. NPDC056579]|uniref:ABC transporter substrate-binding protein n=1 Tax=unclassified Paenibacillus TaxID=185978 RepID=UPI001EF8E6F2|nr:sugar ABC transporter substrate-binding protein [Paenibacillus sp. H1-7]ULL18486.1 sugar ABC transporter substrate-binding protein [Paenibacillus sp. H1-7]